MIKLDYHQLQCPHPVVEARQQLLANPGKVIEVLVGDQTAKENISRLAEKLGYQVSWIAEESNFRLTLTPGAAAPRKEDTSPAMGGKTIVFCNSNQMGRGDKEFGQILLKNFLTTLLELSPLPDTVLFVNSGVRLVCKGSEALETLHRMSELGVDIASCGLCLDYYELKDHLEIGRVTNMLEIAEAQMQAGRIINP
jgi:selenium metabolism protein YedF